MNLTDEDWNSEEATAGAIVAALVVAAGAIAALIVAAAATIAAVAAAVVAAGAIAALIVAADTNNKLMRFPGAYLHYRRRIKHD